MQPVYTAIYAGLLPQDQAVLDRVSSGVPATDDEVCQCVRALYSSIARLDHDQLVAWLVWQVTPWDPAPTPIAAREWRGHPPGRLRQVGPFATRR